MDLLGRIKDGEIIRKIGGGGKMEKTEVLMGLTPEGLAEVRQWMRDNNVRYRTRADGAITWVCDSEDIPDAQKLVEIIG